MRSRLVPLKMRIPGRTRLCFYPLFCRQRQSVSMVEHDAEAGPTG